MEERKCNNTGNSEQLRQNYQVSVQAVRKYACTVEQCEYRGPCQSHLKRHMKGKHTPGRKRDFLCALCPSQFYSTQQLHRHISSHLREEQFKCNHCNFVTHTSNLLLCHRKYKHGTRERKTTCSIPGCNYSTLGPSNLKQHQQTHETDPELKRPFACRIPGCFYRSTRLQVLEKHVWCRHNPNRQRNFICTLCQKAFYDQNALKGHINRVHTNERVYRRENKGECRPSNFEQSPTVKTQIRVQLGPAFSPTQTATMEGISLTEQD